MSNNEEPNLSGFGKSFQERLVQLIIDDFQFAEQIEEVLNTNFFELKYLQVFIEIIFKYKKEYHKYPSRTTIESLLRTELEKENVSVQKQVRDFFAKVLAGGLENIDSEYVMNKSLDFCKKQRLKEAMLKSVALMEKSSFDEISKTINDALKLGIDTEKGYEFIKHFEDRYKPKIRNPISTGWDVIDGITGGGLGKGELGVVIASTGSGKSFCGVHLGSMAMKQGKNVVYYTMELADVVIARRFDSCLTGIPLGSLNYLKDEVFEKVSATPGKLIVKEYPTKSASVQTLKNHLKKLIQKGFEPDMVIVDYGDLIKPASGGKDKDKRIQLEEIYEDLRGMAGEFQLPLYTFSQTNRGAINLEVVTMESISEAFNKCFVADFICSLSRTAIDKQNNSGRIFVAKNRNGPDGLVYPIFMDTSTATIKVFEPTNEQSEQISKDLYKLQADKLKEKYAKHKEEKKREIN